MKVQVSISSTLPEAPGEEHLIYVFVPPTKRFGIPDVTGVGLIPCQKAGSDAVSYLRKLKVTGYDWRPEHLSELELAGLKMFFSTTHQYPDEVEAALGNDGYRTKKITVTAAQWAALEHADTESKQPKADTARVTVGLKAAPAPIGGQTEVSSYYARTRYLWKHHAAQLNDWEQNFVKSIGQRLAVSKPLSDPQIKRLDALLVKHAVPLSATASRNYPDDDLTTLRSPAAGPNYAKFDPSDDLHSYNGGWHGNPAGQSKKAKKTISGYTKAEKKRRKRIEKQKEQEALEREKRRNAEHPKDNANVVDKSLSAEFSSFHGIGDDVQIKFNSLALPAKVLAVAFMEGKVLYTVCVYTGFPDDTTLAEQYGILNSIGWDGDGREFVRVSNLDSTFVEQRPPTGV